VSAVLAIVGLPGSGKSTLAKALGNALGVRTFHTDDFKDFPWNEQPEAVLEDLGLFMQANSAVIVEGFTVCRLFKRGFEPDCVIYILGSDPARTPKGLRTQLERGLDLYAGRVLTLPQHPTLETALWALGGDIED
jgi:adenylate kinase family enzyme